MGVRPLDLWARFDFRRGSCHRCERTNLPVAVLGTMEAYGVTVAFCACHWCIFRVEQLHWAEAERARLRTGGPAPEQQPLPHRPSRRALCVPGVPLRIGRLRGGARDYFRHRTSTIDQEVPSGRNLVADAGGWWKSAG